MSSINSHYDPATRRERFAWCMYDFANSGYTTVILTAIFNAYFVGVVAAESGNGHATLLWTLTIAAANLLVLFSAPVVGAIADYSGAKKRFLVMTTLGCVLFTALLSFVGPGDVILAVILVILATFMFASGENLIAAFLPEISTPETIGRLSGYGWSLGYLGGLLSLVLCLAYVTYAENQGLDASHYVPVCTLIVAALFGIAALPTLLWLRERSGVSQSIKNAHLISIGFERLRITLQHARQHTDLFRFLISLTTYYSGIHIVIVLAAVYAQEVMGFKTQDTIILIMVVNVTAAIGAFLFGHLQDRIGSCRCIAVTLLIWSAAIICAYFATDEALFWVAANLIGIALGGAQSAGRALVGQFTPLGRQGEFFGLWGLATKLSAIIGPLTYGGMVYLFEGDHRIALLSSLVFFILGLALLATVNERRGREIARISY
ncbi:UMF1 family MFS transporter [Nitrosomonas sp. Nm84]|uniref:MFS transporter n=1 Tax=Nitrosomonas sp. Nm84 TaxID=200124 RepID=UPI000D77072C|nr:MFS transporter [Nitrosomonas sp. Nm84]PXW84917.1 UMF1 family MFS transporter [Nitrosomonas sp. Nm84]